MLNAFNHINNHTLIQNWFNQLQGQTVHLESDDWDIGYYPYDRPIRFVDILIYESQYYD